MKQLKNIILLVLTALIWGVAFVAQSSGGDLAGPFTFNGVRSIVGGLVLIPVIFLFTKEKESMKKKRDSLLGGVACGIILFLASTVQQLGICYGESVGKAGFLTALYILMVPILGIFVGRKCGWNIWCGVAIALVGFYFLCMKGKFALAPSDFMLLFSALMFSFHILTIDHFTDHVNGIKMSCVQFMVCGILSIPGMFVWDVPKVFHGSVSVWQASLGTWAVWIPILYAGVLSCGVAYTLQIIGQRGMNPTVASLIMSLESVFSALGGWLILHQKLSARELLGCVLIFVAIVLAQVPVRKQDMV